MVKKHFSVLFVVLLLLSACSSFSNLEMIDNEKPTLQIHSPWWWQVLPSEYTLSVEVDEPGCAIYFSLNFGPYTNLGTISGRAHFIMRQPIDQTNILLMYAVDPSGNHSQTNNVGIIWGAVPSISLTSPYDGAIFAGGNISLGGFAFVESPGALSSIDISFDRGTNYFPVAVSQDWTYSYTPVTGTNYALVRVVSSDGNTNYSQEVVFYVDDLSPGLAISSPLGDAVTRTPQFQVSGTAWDNGVSGLQVVQMSVNGSGFTGISIYPSWSATVDLIPGPNYIQTYSRDYAGNTSVWSNLTINYMFTTTNAGNSEHFGDSVSVSSNGNVVAVGTPDAKGGQGFITIYEKIAGVWSEEAHLTLATPGANDFLGSVMALSSDGNTLVAGVTNNGRVYVFERGTVGWTSGSENAALEHSPVTSAQAFGNSVAISADGSTILVGVPRYDGGASLSGGLFVFKRGAGAGWSDRTAVDELYLALGAAGGEHLGASVSISADGKTMVGGAPYINGSNGALYVFTNGMASSSGVRLSNQGNIANLYLGAGVHISPHGGRIFGGGPGFDGNQGGVLVFEPNANGMWVSTNHKALLQGMSAFPEQMGWILASDWWGTVLLAGVPGAEPSGLTTQGAVYQFVLEGTEWYSQANFHRYFETGWANSGDEFGSGIGTDMEARNIYIGVPGKNVLTGQPGAVYPYTR